MITRMDHDSLGAVPVPTDAYYGAQSLRGAQNFPMTGERMHPSLIRALAMIKKAAAYANWTAGTLSEARAQAIMDACDEILAGKMLDQFIVDPIQGGAGTSANMNANEVIANRACELLGGQKGDYALVHPNDHVNCAQSTNDVFPTAGKLAALTLLDDAQRAVRALIDALMKKAGQFDGVMKIGRTQLQDAVPMRLGQCFHAYASALKRDLARMDAARGELLTINMGGTAIGTALNASRVYLRLITPELSRISGYPLRQAEDLIDCTQNADCYAAVSACVKTCALSMSKIANDLRLLSSGPRAGIGEINLPARQNGSSIMPGKINPVIPEVVTQAAFRIAGNDAAISMAVEAGQLELNAFEPVLFYSLFQSLTLLARAADTFRARCVEGITANESHCRELLMRSAGVATALCPAIGYEKAARLAKEALLRNVSVPDLARETLCLPEAALKTLLDPCRMTEPAPRA